MRNQMDLNGAKAMIMKLHYEGLTNVEIAKRLEAKGYVSPRTKKPINAFGVGFHVRQAEAKKAPAVTLASTRKEAGPVSPGTIKRRSRIELALEILSSELDEGVKAEVATKILNS
jgi:hypothetical protein